MNSSFKKISILGLGLIGTSILHAIKKKLDKEEKDASEKGCTEPIYGEKSKCILHIVPQTKKGNTLQIDDKCLKRTV